MLYNTNGYKKQCDDSKNSIENLFCLLENKIQDISLNRKEIKQITESVASFQGSKKGMKKLLLKKKKKKQLFNFQRSKRISRQTE